jgi:multiple sugar transport system permease protein
MSVLARRPKTPWSAEKKRDFIAGFLFALPWIIGVLAFQAYPMVASLFYSFSVYDIPKAPVFIGLKNFIDMFHDRFFTQALWNSTYLVIIGIPIQLAYSLICALLLNIKIKGQALWRTIYVLPVLMPEVVLAILWNWILNPNLGILNNLLKLVGIKGPLWLASPAWSKPSIVLMQTWAVGIMIILYLAALQGVPEEYYEAAEIDGATPLQKFFLITIPMISPVTLFQLITSISWALQYFTTAYILGTASGSLGAPQGSTLFYGLYLYQVAFVYLRMGYASALAWMLFIISAAASWIVLKVSNRWTYYNVV